MVYKFFYLVLRGFHAVFFRAIYVIGQDRVNWSKPNLVASTHPNSFLDAVVFADSLKPPMHFLARGDVFKKGFVEWLFIRQFNMIPIYRREETSDSSKKNKSIFRWVYRLLNERANVMIFSEGYSVPEKRVRPIKKGTAFMAFGAMEEYGTELDVHIVPVGLNYPNHQERYEMVYIVIAEPIRVLDYWDLLKKSEAEGVKAITQELSRRLKEVMIIIEEKEAEPLANLLLEMVRNDIADGHVYWLRHAPHKFTVEQNTANHINAVHANDPDEFRRLNDLRLRYEQKLQKHRLTDAGVSEGQKIRMWERLVLIIGWFVFLPGQVLTFLPKRFGHWFVNKRKLKGSQWYLSIYYGLELVLFAILFIISIILAFSKGGTLLGWISIPALIFLSIGSERYLPLFFRWRRRIKWRWFKKRNPKEAAEVLTLREELKTQIQQ